MKMTRRKFLVLGGLAGAGLAVGIYVGVGREQVKTAETIWDVLPKGFAPNVWLHIDKEGMVTVRVNHTEMGQGITTALPQIVADELCADWSKVKAEIAPAESVYKNPEYGIQMTGGSTSVTTSWDILRAAGAEAREMLIRAAAKKAKTDSERLYAENGAIVNRETRDRIPFGELISEAVLEPVIKEAPLKKPTEFKLIGRSIPRVDSEAKINGTAVFGMDVIVPGMLNARMIHPPHVGGSLKGFDKSNVMKLPGIKDVVPVENGLAVVAGTFWQAQSAAESIRADWNPGPDPDLDDEKLFKEWAGLSNVEAKTLYEKGEDLPVPDGLKTVKAEYTLPFQAHATQEPMNCTAHVQPGRCDVWAPTQNQDAAQEVAARITGLKYEDVHIHTTYVGGGFGRRSAVDYVAEAVSVSKVVGSPIKVVWTREEDIKNDRFRPASYNFIEAGLDEKGKPAFWKHRLVGPDDLVRMMEYLAPSVLPYVLPRGARNLAAWGAGNVVRRVKKGDGAGEGASPLPYDIDRVRVEYVFNDPGVPLGFWRSVGHSGNAFVVESFIDELAHAAGRDPLEYRLELLSPTPRMKIAAEAVGEMSGWGRKQPGGLHLGLATHEFHHAIVGMVAALEVQSETRFQVRRVYAAVDCGQVVNPRLVERQVRSGVAFGLTATVKSAITIREGQIRQGNFDDFPILKMDEMPEVFVAIINSKEKPLGVGEIAVPPVAPAVANALFAATGQRVRKLPLV